MVIAISSKYELSLADALHITERIEGAGWPRAGIALSRAGELVLVASPPPFEHAVEAIATEFPHFDVREL